ncbi:MAG TPA: prohibitin family protein [bacterium]|jgi:regulator of protease activity HflC (stomatin/prohibitin superfamily)|nr:prohibitin family protein [bacterium]
MGALKFVLFLAAALFLFWRTFGVEREPGRREPTWRFRGSRSFVGGLIVFLAINVLLLGFGQVPAGARGVVLRFGAITGDVKGEGIYFITPWVETVEVMSVQTEAYEAESAAASFDLQDVRTKVTLNYSLDPAGVATVYQTLRREFVTRIIKPAVQEAVKASTAKFKADELITRRETVREQIQRVLDERLNKHGIRVDAVSITDFSFSEEFTKAIEAKVTATQRALEAQQNLERVKFEAQQAIERAKAEAEALRLQRQNVTAELVELRRIEAQMKAIEKWNGQMPQFVGAGGPVPILDLFNTKGR